MSSKHHKLRRKHVSIEFWSWTGFTSRWKTFNERNLQLKGGWGWGSQLGRGLLSQLSGVLQWTSAHFPLQTPPEVKKLKCFFFWICQVWKGLLVHSTLLHWVTCIRTLNVLHCSTWFRNPLVVKRWQIKSQRLTRKKQARTSTFRICTIIGTILALNHSLDSDKGHEHTHTAMKSQSCTAHLFVWLFISGETISDNLGPLLTAFFGASCFNLVQHCRLHIIRPSASGTLHSCIAPLWQQIPENCHEGKWRRNISLEILSLEGKWCWTVPHCEKLCSSVFIWRENDSSTQTNANVCSKA